MTCVMGNLCPKPDHSATIPTFSDAILKVQTWQIVETPVFNSMLSSFKEAYKNDYDTVSQFARASLISAGLADISEGLDDQGVIIVALVLAWRVKKKKLSSITI